LPDRTAAGSLLCSTEVLGGVPHALRPTAKITAPPRLLQIFLLKRLMLYVCHQAPQRARTFRFLTECGKRHQQMFPGVWRRAGVFIASPPLTTHPLPLSPRRPDLATHLNDSTFVIHDRVFCPAPFASRENSPDRSESVGYSHWSAHKNPCHLRRAPWLRI